MSVAGAADAAAPAAVVVADDNVDILKLLRIRLSKRGYDVRTATDGREALDAVRADPPAAVVLDWMMPLLSGPEVCAELKRDPVTAGIPVVLLTARATDSDLATGEASGADAYLTKPFEIEELDETLRRLIPRTG